MAAKSKAKHISQKFSFKGILSRNTTYREDARSHLKAKGIYDDLVMIETGILTNDKASGHKSKVPMVQRVNEYTFDFFRVKLGNRNFESGGAPYGNDAHHMIPVEVFTAAIWKLKELHVVLATGYDVNHATNIILLPQCYGKKQSCQYHMLPDHSDGHYPAYNLAVAKLCDAVHNLVCDALKEKDCKKRKDIRQQVLDKLNEIEEDLFDHLSTVGPGPMSAP
jgi:HNH/ENDO VII superfamily nuclease